MANLWPGTLGLRGEFLAANYLRQKGHLLLAQRFRTVHGEIDLISLDGDVVVFSEVKTRSDTDILRSLERIDPAKQKRMIGSARWFLRRSRMEDRSFRFDVIVVIQPKQGDPQIVHFPYAFSE